MRKRKFGSSPFNRSPFSRSPFNRSPFGRSSSRRSSTFRRSLSRRTSRLTGRYYGRGAEGFVGAFFSVVVILFLVAFAGGLIFMFFSVSEMQSTSPQTEGDSYFFSFFYFILGIMALFFIFLIVSLFKNARSSLTPSEKEDMFSPPSTSSASFIDNEPDFGPINPTKSSYCSVCGEKVDPEDMFCSHCGSPL